MPKEQKRKAEERRSPYPRNSRSIRENRRRESKGKAVDRSTPEPSGPPPGGNGGSAAPSGSGSSSSALPAAIRTQTENPVPGWPKLLDVDALGLDQSWVDVYKDPAVPKEPQYKRWKNPGKDPLDDLPSDWDVDERDLDDDDIEGHIERCKERIEDNILPDMFKKRLKGWEEAKANKDVTMAKYGNKLEWIIVKRIEELKDLKEWLLEEGDKLKLVPCVDAIMAAYQSGELGWHRGLVTYWSKGVQLSKPRPYDDHEYIAICWKHKGWESFWVEGHMQTKPAANYFSHRYERDIAADGNFRVYYKLRIAFLVPAASTDYGSNLMFRDDTGSDYMVIHEEDVEALTKSRNPVLPIVGVTHVILANGQKERFIVRKLLVGLDDPVNPSGGPSICDYDLIPFVARTKGYTPMPRLSGPWLRQKFYTASVPDGSTANLHIFDKKSAYTSTCPVVTVELNDRKLRAIPLRPA